MKKTIQLKLFATLSGLSPENAEAVPIDPGITIEGLLEQVKIPKDKARLIFINGVKSDLGSQLKGGERIGIFPPVGGG